MFYYIIAVFAFAIAVLPRRATILARLLGLFSGASSLIYGLAAQDIYAFPTMGSLAQYIALDDSPATGQAVTAAMTLLITVLAAYIGRASSAELPATRHEPSLSVPQSISAFLIALTTICLFAQIMQIGLDTLWSYQGYGSIGDTNRLYENNAFGKVVATGLRPLVMALVAVTVLNYTTGARSIAYIATIPLVIALLLGLAEASRITVVYSGFAAACCYVQRARFASWVGAIVAVLALMYSLEARRYSDLGLSYIPHYIIQSLTSTDSFESLIVNIFCNILVMDASIQSAAVDGYNFAYKILSFMPSIDAIDGFRDVLATQQQRVSFAIPFNTFAEAWLFGFPYFIALWSILICACLCVNFGSRQGKIFSVLYLGMFLLGWVQASQYPVRNSLRYFYAIILIYFIVDFFQSRVFKAQSGIGGFAARKRQPGRPLA